MKHLIPYLQDDQKAADYLRQLRWPEGITCPRCGSDTVEPRERCDNGLQRFNCMLCAARLGQQFAMFTDWTGSIFEESKLRPLEWLLVIGLWQLKLNTTEIAAAADIQARTAQRCINLLARLGNSKEERGLSDAPCSYATGMWLFLAVRCVSLR
jgi:transposase-like protein